MVELVTNRLERVAPGAGLVASRPAGPSSSRSLEVVRARPLHPGAAAAHGLGRWVVAFAGVEGIDQAERLRGAVLGAAPLEDEEALWVHRLVGTRVFDADGSDLGVVTAVEANPASDLLVLDGGALVPLRFVTGQGDGRITVDVPPGLLEL